MPLTRHFQRRPCRSRRRPDGPVRCYLQPLELHAPAPVRGSRASHAGDGQDAKLAPHATPLTVTPLDKIPVDKLKVPAGFKVDIWAHGMPGARMMVRGDKGTIFVGTRVIGKVYAITDKGASATHKVIPRAAAAEWPRL